MYDCFITREFHSCRTSLINILGDPSIAFVPNTKSPEKHNVIISPL